MDATPERVRTDELRPLDGITEWCMDTAVPDVARVQLRYFLGRFEEAFVAETGAGPVATRVDA